jgi:hypothetical protein
MFTLALEGDATPLTDHSVRVRYRVTQSRRAS